MCATSKIGAPGRDWRALSINVSNCSAAIANDGTFEALTMLLVMPVSEVMAAGIVNRPGFTSVLNAADGSESDCAASSMIRLFSLLNPVVSKSKTIMVGNSDESRDTVGAFVFGASSFVFAAATAGVRFDPLATPPMFDETTDVAPARSTTGAALGGDHARGVCGDLAGGAVSPR